MKVNENWVRMNFLYRAIVLGQSGKKEDLEVVHSILGLHMVLIVRVGEVKQMYVGIEYDEVEAEEGDSENEREKTEE